MLVCKADCFETSSLECCRWRESLDPNSCLHHCSHCVSRHPNVTSFLDLVELLRLDFGKAEAFLGNPEPDGRIVECSMVCFHGCAYISTNKTIKEEDEAYFVAPDVADLM